MVGTALDDLDGNEQRGREGEGEGEVWLSEARATSVGRAGASAAALNAWWGGREFCGSACVELELRVDEGGGNEAAGSLLSLSVIIKGPWLAALGGSDAETGRGLRSNAKNSASIGPAP